MSVPTAEMEAWERKVAVLVRGLRSQCAGYQHGQALAAIVELACQFCEEAGMPKADFLIKVTDHWERREDELKEAPNGH